MRLRPGFNTRDLFSSLASNPRAYKYQPLPFSTSLRLLEVQSPTIEKIGCSLKTFKIDDAPPFNALSYTWGYPLIPESSPLRNSSWRRLEFPQRVEVKSPQLPHFDGYHAFSNQNDTENTTYFPINCDGRTLHVTANLHDALVMLANDHVGGLEKQKYVWVDALCIDQSNLAERNQQVSLMADIFKTAQGVLVWLGDEDEFTEDAFTVVERISSTSRQTWRSVPYTGFYGDGQCYLDAGIEPLSYHNWLGFIAFINRPWFKRAWVVQELALARSATVICGSRILPWEELSKTIEFVRATRWYHHLSTKKMKHISQVRHNPGVYAKFIESETRFGLTPVYLSSTRNSLQFYVQGDYKMPPSLRVLMDTHRHTNATDPRDKVYAFLSLADRGRHPFKGGHEMIQPDYQTPVQRVYRQAACAFLRSYRNLYLLSHVQDQSFTKVDGLPSWVPDYSIPLHPYPLEFRGNCNWFACGELKWTLPEDHDLEQTGLLPVQGFLVDTIAETATMPHEAIDAGEPWASIVEVVSRIPNHYPITSMMGLPITRLEALWRTLVNDTYARQHPAPPSCGTLFIDYILNLQIRHRLAPWSSADAEFQPHQTPVSTLKNPAWRDLLASEPPDSPFSLSLYRDRLIALVENMLSKDAYSPVALAQLHHDIETGCGRVRRLFRTKDLTLLGTGARSLQAGDEVWILAGGRVPYILRRVNGEGRAESGSHRYRLIGEAYVHGIMHGDLQRLDRELISTILE